jgi:hypothetical protein
MSDILDEALNQSFINPSRVFDGKELAPYTEGSRLLLMQIRSDEDSSAYFVWAFIYLHILLKENRKEAISLAWNKDLFKERLLDWIGTKSETDREKATELCSQMVEEAARARVEVIPNPLESPEGKA